MPAYNPMAYRGSANRQVDDDGTNSDAVYEPVMIVSDTVLSNDGDVMVAKGVPDAA